MSVATAAPNASGILGCFGRLDALLEHAMRAAELAYGAEPAADPFRGLYVTRAHVHRMFEREPGALRLGDDDPLPPAADARLGSIAAVYALTQFETDALLVALAPEIDLRYERIYGYLQDDVTRKRPTVDLMLNLLCTSAADKIVSRAAFGPGSRLIRGGLVHVVYEPGPERPPLLSGALAVDEQVVHWLLADGSLSARLAKFAVLRRDRRPEMFLGDGLVEGLQSLLRADGRMRLLVHGPAVAPRGHVAHAVARTLDRAVLEVDLERAPAGDDLAEAVRAVTFVCRTERPVLLLKVSTRCGGPIVGATRRRCSQSSPRLMSRSCSRRKRHGRALPPHSMTWSRSRFHDPLSHCGGAGGKRRSMKLRLPRPTATW